MGDHCPNLSFQYCILFSFALPVGDDKKLVKEEDGCNGDIPGEAEEPEAGGLALVKSSSRPSPASHCRRDQLLQSPACRVRSLGEALQQAPGPGVALPHHAVVVVVVVVVVTPPSCYTSRPVFRRIRDRPVCQNVSFTSVVCLLFSFLSRILDSSAPIICLSLY